MSIKLLSNLIANQIAAGEVVERPASVVKEMVENSLDAGATKVRVEILNGGRSLIKIVDNGSGIPKEELKLALTRYATSKIESLSDLDSLASFGFRGEALASISSVSRLTLISKTSDQECAWQIHVEGALDEPAITPAALPEGTTILVEDLFFNTPARRRFLKSDKTEFSHIQELILKLALANPNIAFTLIHNGKSIYNLQSANTEEQILKRYTQLLGRAFTEQMLPVNEQQENIAIEGYILPAPDETDSTPEVQYMFLNGRIVKEKNVFHAIKQAYTEIYAKEVKSNFVIFLTIDPSDVDVNVHPTKHEVRFQEARYVHDFVVLAILNALSTVATKALKTEHEHFYASHDDLEYVTADNLCNQGLQNSQNPYGSHESTTNTNALSASDPNTNITDDLDDPNTPFIPENEQKFPRSTQSNYSGYSNNHSYPNTFNPHRSFNRPERDQEQYNAYSNWITSTIGSSQNNIESHNEEIRDLIKTNNQYVIYGLEQNYAIVGYEQALYAIDLKKLDYKYLKTELSETEQKSSLLMLPLLLNMEEAQKERLKANQEVLKALGFTINILEQKNKGVQIIAVPGIIRRFNISVILAELFNLPNWDQNRDQFIEFLIETIQKNKKPTLVDFVQELDYFECQTVLSDLTLCHKIPLAKLVATLSF